jgi:hypothetical protein
METHSTEDGKFYTYGQRLNNWVFKGLTWKKSSTSKHENPSIVFYFEKKTIGIVRINSINYELLKTSAM